MTVASLSPDGGDEMPSKEELEVIVERLKKEKSEYEEYVERQITRIVGVISQVATGDFSVRAEHEREDDLGALAMGANMMIEEIGKLNTDLEERIKSLEKTTNELEKTKKELEEKVEDLEKMHKFMMGREKRMIELKDKVWELERKLKEKETKV